MEDDPVFEFQRVACGQMERFVVAQSGLYERVVLRIAHPPGCGVAWVMGVIQYRHSVYLPVLLMPSSVSAPAASAAEYVHSFSPSVGVKELPGRHGIVKPYGQAAIEKPASSRFTSKDFLESSLFRLRPLISLPH